MLPTLFIGSAKESLDAAYAVQEELEHDAECTVWTQGVFNASSTAMQDLLASASRFDFAVFVFVPHDLVRLRQTELPAVRDNLLFELGLFIGRLGPGRVFFLVPRDVEIHLPTDLLGITPLTYLSTRQDGNLRASVGSACNKLRTVLRDHDRLPLGPVPRRTRPPSARAERGISAEEQKVVRRVVESVARKGRRHKVLLLADIDGLTGIAKWHGKDVADRITDMVGGICASVAGREYWARLGGDEFLLCLADIDEPRALLKASELVNRIALHDWGQIVPNLYVRASVGVAPAAVTEDVEAWIIRAINGAILAKRAGGNRAHLAPLKLPRTMSTTIHDYLSHF